MTNLETLASKVEGVGGGDRALDWEIHLRDGLDGVGMYGDHPAYTGSLDAAMTLVPQGWTFANLTQSDTRGWWCELRQGFLTSYDKAAMGRQLNNANPAIAIVAASLRARSLAKGG
jgi:hypothetical protein